jgi:hypothetical protein
MVLPPFFDRRLLTSLLWAGRSALAAPLGQALRMAEPPPALRRSGVATHDDQRFKAGRRLHASASGAKPSVASATPTSRLTRAVALHLRAEVRGVTLSAMGTGSTGKGGGEDDSRITRSKNQHPSGHKTKVRGRSKGDVVALRPERLRRTVEQAKRHLDEIAREYEWLYTDVYAGRSGSGEVSRSDPAFSDQTGITAMNAAERSGQVRRISGVLEQMETVLAGLAKSVRARPEGTERPDQYPPTVNPDELQSLREAKSRREGRGEGWGGG